MKLNKIKAIIVEFVPNEVEELNSYNITLEKRTSRGYFLEKYNTYNNISKVNSIINDCIGVKKLMDYNDDVTIYIVDPIYYDEVVDFLSYELNLNI